MSEYCTLVATDPETLWLTVANEALGVAVLICCLAIVAAVIYEFTVRAHRRAQIIRNADAAMHAMFHPGTGGPQEGESAGENGRER
jgi:hypothetical protein